METPSTQVGKYHKVIKPKGYLYHTVKYSTENMDESLALPGASSLSCAVISGGIFCNLSDLYHTVCSC